MPEHSIAVEFLNVRKVAASSRHQADGAADNCLVRETRVAADGKKPVPQEHFGNGVRMPETKKNPPFNERFSEDVLNLMLAMITFWVMQLLVLFLLFIICCVLICYHIISLNFLKLTSRIQEILYHAQNGKNTARIFSMCTVAVRRLLHVVVRKFQFRNAQQFRDFLR